MTKVTKHAYIAIICFVRFRNLELEYLKRLVNRIATIGNTPTEVDAPLYLFQVLDRQSLREAVLSQREVPSQRELSSQKQSRAHPNPKPPRQAVQLSPRM